MYGCLILIFIIYLISFNWFTLVSFSDKQKSEDYDISINRRRISVAEDILRSPDDDSISVASAFSQRSDGEDEAEVSDNAKHYIGLYVYDSNTCCLFMSCTRRFGWKVMKLDIFHEFFFLFFT